MASHPSQATLLKMPMFARSPPLRFGPVDTQQAASFKLPRKEHRGALIGGMGHIHLGRLPGTQRWRQVVELLQDGRTVNEVIEASAVAAENDFARAANDPTLVEAVRLLALIPEAARSENFGESLRSIGLDVPDAPLLSDLLLAAGQAQERILRQPGNRTDFSEIVRRALLGTLSDRIGDALPSLFEAEAGDVKSAASQLRRPPDFAVTARTFFGRLTADTLASWLDRTLSAQVGPDKRFASLGERAAFDGALNQYCVEATRIIREFAAGWYGKTLYRDGTITPERAAAFSAVAFKKITEELRRKRDHAEG